MTRLTLLLLGLLISSAIFAEIPTQEARFYDQNPRHLWNRLHQTLFIRVAPDGTTYGHDRLDPLYWGMTRHLLEDSSHREALQLLDEFLSKHGERIIRDPLKRAFLQHDLWALFAWSARPYGSQYDRERKELWVRLAQIIRRLALTSQEIASLPDNYARAGAAANAPAALPHGLFQREGDWVNLIADGGTAPNHVQNFGGRSTFHVLLRLPGGRAATLTYLERLNSFERPWIYVESPPAPTYPVMMNPELPQFPSGTEWALVRRMRVIDTDGNIRPTPIIESIELRRYLVVPTGNRFASHEEQVNAQRAFEFVASRIQGGDLREVLAGEKDFYQFQAHDSDPFEISAEDLARWYRDQNPFRNQLQRDVLRSCFTCHAAAGIQSVQSFARVTNDRRLSAPKLSESDPDRILRDTVHWNSYQYGLLRGLWER